ncbi:hypothetical protein ADP8_05253 (plasmid) [Roseomonas mucosa]|nr:hypothetical protein ADP8_05253 [Roseomonas mucosa]
MLNSVTQRTFGTKLFQRRRFFPMVFRAESSGGAEMRSEEECAQSSAFHPCPDPIKGQRHGGS